MSMQHVSLRQLRVFEAAAENRSFSKAAEALHLTQPGVSMHIKELESHAGLPLFERVGRKLFVTEAGQELLVRASEVIRSLKDADEAFDGRKGLRRGRINLAIVSTAKYFAPRLLARFRDEFPQLEIRLAVNNRTSVVEQIASNEVDLAIMGRAPDTLDIVAQAFAENPHVIIAAPNHPLRRVARFAGGNDALRRMDGGGWASLARPTHSAERRPRRGRAAAGRAARWSTVRRRREFQRPRAVPSLQRLRLFSSRSARQRRLRRLVVQSDRGQLG